MSHVFHARLHLLGWPQKQWHPLYVACKAVDKVIADAETPHLQHALLGKRIECAVDMMQSKLMLRGMLSATNKLASCRQLKALHACIPADAGVHWPLVYTCTWQPQCWVLPEATAQISHVWQAGSSLQCNSSKWAQMTPECQF